MENSQETHTLPKELGKSPVERLTWFYIKILKNKMGTDPVINYGMAGKIFKGLLRGMTEIQVASIVMAHCNYASIKDNNGWLEKTLRSRVYPLTMLLSNVNVYKTYLIYEKQIEFDDLDTLKDVVYKYADRL